MRLPFPIPPGTLITAELLNQLVASIEDGTIYSQSSFVGDLVTTLETRVATLEAEVAVLEAEHSTVSIREQFQLSAAQGTIPLSHTPQMDAELVFFNGLSLAKSGVPLGFSGDYSISGSTLTLASSLAPQVVAGDLLVVVYRYQV